MPGLAAKLMKRRVPHVLAIYAGASWGLVEFMAFAVDEFLLSPHWTRVVMVGVLLILPSVLMLAWFHGAPGRDEMARVEKVGIPANLAFAVVVLWALFDGEDLGAATTSVSVETEDGETVERVIPKTEFRKRTAVFPLDLGPGLGDDDAWLAYAVPVALLYDLMPDDFFEPVSFQSFGHRLSGLGFPNLLGVPLALKREVSEELHVEFMATGLIDRTDDRYRVELAVYEVDTGALAGETAREGPDLLELVDQLSVGAKEVLKIPARGGIEDLPARERLTANAAAMEEFGRGFAKIVVEGDLPASLQHVDAATSLDPTFAVAQHLLSSLLLNDNRPREAVAPLQAALDHLYRFPERVRFQVKSDYYFATQQTDKAWGVLGMWVELYPEDLLALRNYVFVQRMRGDWTALLETLGTMYRLSPEDADLLKEMAEAHLELGGTDQALVLLTEYMERFPEDHSGLLELAQVHRRRGEHDVARDYVERATILRPRLSTTAAALASLDVDAGRFEDARKGYERAMELARTPVQRVAVLTGLKRYHSIRGEAENTVLAIDRWVEESYRYTTPITIVQSRFYDIPLLFGVGRHEEAVVLFEELRTQVEPPLSDYFVPHLAIHVLLETEGAEAAREAHGRAVEVANARQFGALLPVLEGDLGRIHERAGDYDAAFESYAKAMKLNPGRTHHRDAGRVLRKAGRLDEAESELHASLRLVPGHPRTHFEMALLLEAQDNIPGALEHLRRALEGWATADDAFEPAQRARAKLAELEG